MICQNCLKNAATVHVTEIASPVIGSPEQVAQDAAAAAAPQVTERHLCEVCAQTLDLPHAPAQQKAQLDIWKLLQITAKQTRRKGSPTCAGCGLQLEEFRRKGRLGCPQCYTAFAAHLGEVLERVHGARQHVGRLPGSDAMIPEAPADAVALEREQRLVDLRRKLETAIREEAYENAARLRDELKQLEEPRKS
jgi:protein arginine kinase activator